MGSSIPSHLTSKSVGRRPLHKSSLSKCYFPQFLHFFFNGDYKLIEIIPFFIDTSILGSYLQEGFLACHPFSLFGKTQKLIVACIKRTFSRIGLVLTSQNVNGILTTLRIVYLLQRFLFMKVLSLGYIVGYRNPCVSQKIEGCR